METKIEVWHNKSSLRKTCVNIPRCIPPLPPLLQCWHHTSLVFVCFLVHRASSLPVPSTTLSRGEGGDEVPCKRQMRHFDFAFHLLSKSFFRTKSSRLVSQWALCFCKSKEWFVFTFRVSFLSFFAEQPKGGPLRLQKSAVNTQ